MSPSNRYGFEYEYWSNFWNSLNYSKWLHLLQLIHIKKSHQTLIWWRSLEKEPFQSLLIWIQNFNPQNKTKLHQYCPYQVLNRLFKSHVLYLRFRMHIQDTAIPQDEVLQLVGIVLWKHDVKKQSNLYIWKNYLENSHFIIDFRQNKCIHKTPVHS